MQTPAITHLLGSELLKAWGIDDRFVYGFTINFEANKAVTVTITQEVPDDDGKRLGELLTTYRLLREEDVNALLALEQKSRP